MAPDVDVRGQRPAFRAAAGEPGAKGFPALRPPLCLQPPPGHALHRRVPGRPTRSETLVDDWRSVLRDFSYSSPELEHVVAVFTQKCALMGLQDLSWTTSTMMDLTWAAIVITWEALQSGSLPMADLELGAGANAETLVEQADEWGDTLPLDISDAAVAGEHLGLTTLTDAIEDPAQTVVIRAHSPPILLDPAVQAAAVQALECLQPEIAARLLELVQPDVAAQVVGQLPGALVSDILRGASSNVGACVLGCFSPEAGAELVRELPLQNVTMMLQQLPPQQAQATVRQLPPEQAEELLVSGAVSMSADSANLAVSASAGMQSFERSGHASVGVVNLDQTAHTSYDNGLGASEMGQRGTMQQISRAKTDSHLASSLAAGMSSSPQRVQPVRQAVKRADQSAATSTPSRQSLASSKPKTKSYKDRYEELQEQFKTSRAEYLQEITTFRSVKRDRVWNRDMQAALEAALEPDVITFLPDHTFFGDDEPFFKAALEECLRVAIMNFKGGCPNCQAMTDMLKKARSELERLTEKLANAESSMAASASRGRGRPPSKPPAPPAVTETRPPPAGNIIIEKEEATPQIDVAAQTMRKRFEQLNIPEDVYMDDKQFNQYLKRWREIQKAYEELKQKGKQKEEEPVPREIKKEIEVVRTRDPPVPDPNVKRLEKELGNAQAKIRELEEALSAAEARLKAIPPPTPEVQTPVVVVSDVVRNTEPTTVRLDGKERAKLEQALRDEEGRRGAAERRVEELLRELDALRLELEASKKARQVEAPSKVTVVAAPVEPAKEPAPEPRPAPRKRADGENARLVLELSEAKQRIADLEVTISELRGKIDELRDMLLAAGVAPEVVEKAYLRVGLQKPEAKHRRGVFERLYIDAMRRYENMKLLAIVLLRDAPALLHELNSKNEKDVQPGGDENPPESTAITSVEEAVMKADKLFDPVKLGEKVKAVLEANDAKFFRTGPALAGSNLDDLLGDCVSSESLSPGRLKSTDVIESDPVPGGVLGLFRDDVDARAQSPRKALRIDTLRNGTPGRTVRLGVDCPLCGALLKKKAFTGEPSYSPEASVSPREATVQDAAAGAAERSTKGRRRAGPGDGGQGGAHGGSASRCGALSASHDGRIFEQYCQKLRALADSTWPAGLPREEITPAKAAKSFELRQLLLARLPAQAEAEAERLRSPARPASAASAGATCRQRPSESKSLPHLGGPIAETRLGRRAVR